MDVIEFVAFVIKSALFLLIVSLVIWVFFRPLVISYHLLSDGIDIMLLSFYKLYHIDFSNVTDIRVVSNMSLELADHNLIHFRQTKVMIDKLFPKQIMIITIAATANGKIRYLILSTTPLEYIRDHTKLLGSTNQNEAEEMQ